MALDHHSIFSGVNIMNTRFQNANGDVSLYGFACGHIQRKEENNIRLDLWKEGVWHVRAHEFDGRGRLFWESFDTLTQARKFFAKQKKQVFAN
jgi:hypothetical protein